MALRSVFNVNILSKRTFFWQALFPKNILNDPNADHKVMECGVIYDKKPAKVPIEAGKKYSWCSCGRSNKQPFCDGTHNKKELNIKQKPIIFAVEKSKQYRLCNCKQTSNRPFCDGTHLSRKVRKGTSVLEQQ